MGGYGSGRREGSKQTTCSYERLDVRQWQRDGFLVVGRSFGFGVWDIDVIARVKRDEPGMALFNHRNKSLQQHEPYRVWIEWTHCNYGGKRAWFVCPRGCGHRVAILYYDDSPACRHCYQLAYNSQRDSAKTRSLHAAQAIRMQLGGSGCLADPFPPKPKGMQWHTYDGLFAKARVREKVFWGSMAGWLTKFADRRSKSSTVGGR